MRASESARSVVLLAGFQAEFARANFYDVWLPDLAPSEPLLKAGRGATSEAEWQRFRRRYRSEMGRPTPRRLLDVLAALLHAASFSLLLRK